MVRWCVYVDVVCSLKVPGFKSRLTYGSVGDFLVDDGRLLSTLVYQSTGPGLPNTDWHNKIFHARKHRSSSANQLISFLYFC